MNEYFVNKNILIFFSDWRIVEFWPFLTHCSLFSDLSESGSEYFQSLVNSRFFLEWTSKRERRSWPASRLKKKFRKNGIRQKFLKPQLPSLERPNGILPRNDFYNFQKKDFWVRALQGWSNQKFSKKYDALKNLTSTSPVFPTHTWTVAFT